MKEIKVSVIIPVYNTEAYIKATLDSILHQSLKEIEIIVINDGSIDDSLKVIHSVAGTDKRVRVYSQGNKGLSATRNYGIEKAQGEFIYFMDSDDLLIPTTLEACYDACKAQGLDFLFFDAEVFGQTDDTTVINYQRTHHLEEGVYNGPDILSKLLREQAFLSSACLNFIHLPFLKKIHLTFYPEILHEDELFTLLLFLQARKVSFIPHPYFKRRIRNHSIMTSTFTRKNVTGYFTVAKELLIFRSNNRENHFISVLIDKRLRDMFAGVLYKARRMKRTDRHFVFITCLRHFRKYTTLKDLGLLLVPIYIYMRKR